MVRSTSLKFVQRAVSSYGARYLHSTSLRCQNVSIESIKELRKRTGAPISDVKNALIEQSGDLEAAIDHLRKLGASLAAKKAHRDASEGLIGIAFSAHKDCAAIVEVNSETDFVARTPQFGQLVRESVQAALLSGQNSNAESYVSIGVDELMKSGKCRDMFSQAVSALGENIVLRRACYLRIEKGSGAIYGYTHRSVGEGNGIIGALVALEAPYESATDCKALDEAGSRLAMHIAAASPSYVSRDRIPPEDVEKERAVILGAILEEQKGGSKEKPKNILDKVVEGRLKKWMSNAVLTDQVMLVETDTYSDSQPRSVMKHLNEELQRKASITDMVYYRVGEDF